MKMAKKAGLLKNLNSLREANMAGNLSAYNQAPDEVRERDDNLWKGLDKTYKKLPVSSLYPIDDQPFILNPAKVEAFAQTIKDIGMLQPIVVHQTGLDDNGYPKYEIISGRHRWKAHIQLGLKEVDCVIVRCEPEQVGLLVNVCNQQRGELRKTEQALLIVSMENYSKPTGEKYNMKEIADMYGLSFKTGYRLKHLLELIKPLQQKVDDGMISVNAIEKIAQLLNKTQQGLLNEYMDKVKRKISEKDIDKLAVLAKNNPSFTTEDIIALLNKKKEKSPYKVDVYNRIKMDFGGKVDLNESEMDELVYSLLTEYFRNT